MVALVDWSRAVQLGAAHGCLGWLSMEALRGSHGLSLEDGEQSAAPASSIVAATNPTIFDLLLLTLLPLTLVGLAFVL